MIRLSLALVVLLGLTAFAPAPFPKADRSKEAGDSISLQLFQGKWKHSRIVMVEDNGNLRDWKNGPVVAIRVKGDQWIYLQENDVVNTTYTITVQDARGPAAIDWFDSSAQGKKGLPFMLGLIRRKGDRIEILGRMTNNPADRPKSFTNPPTGWWIMTLDKVP